MALISRRTFMIASTGLLAAGASGAGYAGYVEPALQLVVTEYRPVLPAWPADFPLSIAIVTDIHAGGYAMSLSRIQGIVERTNALNPDLILHLGDHEADYHFDYKPIPQAGWGEALSALKAPLGVYGVLGNHDWWRNLNSIRSTLARAGLAILENEGVRLEKNGRKFWLLGLGDQQAFRHGPRRNRIGVDDLPKTLAAAASDDPALLMVHEPDIFVEVPKRVALTVAGHTHGGQIWFPGMPGRFIPSAYGARFRYGHIVEGGRHLIVSGGLGTTGFPVRFGVPPEIVMIRLGAAGPRVAAGAPAA